MSASPIDALLQLAPPKRGVEAPPRGGDGRAFGPALEQAYASEKSRESRAPAPADESAVEDIQDESLEADSGLGDRTKAAGEEAEVAEHADSSTEETSDSGDAEDEPISDDVEVSELASAAVEAEEAAKAKEVAVAIANGKAAIVPATVDADATSTEEQATDGAARTAGKSGDATSGGGDEAATAEGQRADAARGRALTEDGVPVMFGENAYTESAVGTSTGDEPSVDEARPTKANNDETANESPDDAKANDAQRTEGDGGLKVPAALVEQQADAAVIERQISLVDRAAVTEAASAEPASAPAVDASNGGTTTQRVAATLDRLAATTMRRADEAAGTDGGPQIDRPRFVQRVEGALRAAQQRDGRIQVRLAPPELGVVHIELAVQNGVMTAKLEAETAAARNALLDNLPALRERLAEQNIRVEKFDVDVRRDPQQGGGNNSPGDRPDGQGESNSHARRGRPATTPTAAATPKTARIGNATSNAGLDVRI